jgi:hypothetical protein
MFILLAPALFAASIYMILGRIILLVGGQEHSIIRPQWLTKIFVIGDVICFLLLAGGESYFHDRYHIRKSPLLTIMSHF